MASEDTLNILAHLKQMAEGDALEVEWYHKALVIAAFESLKEDDLPSAMGFLAQVPPTYYSGQIKEHMTQDLGFAEKAVMLAEVFIQRGMVHVGAEGPLLEA